MITLKYDNFRFSWAAVTEKKKLLNSVFTKVPYFCDRILNDKSAFFPGYSYNK